MCPPRSRASAPASRLTFCWITWPRDDATPHASPAGRLAPAPARRRRAAVGAAAHRRAVRARHRDAEPEAAGHDHRAGHRLSRAHPRRAAGGQRLRAADDAVSDRPHGSGRDATAPRRAASSTAASSIPAGATTNSDSGVTDIRRIDAALEAMAASGPAAAGARRSHARDVDVFDREARFIDAVLAPLRARLPRLRIVFEHVTTRAAVRVRAGAAAGRCGHDHAAASGAEPQRAVPGRHPSASVLPAGAQARDATARRCSMPSTAGDPRFFLGTDSAPHARGTKENACGCAGIYSAHAALELYAEIFEDAGALHRLEAFASEFGPRFYGLPLNQRHHHAAAPATGPFRPHYPFAGETIVPLRAGETLRWRLRRRHLILRASMASPDLASRRFRGFLPVVIDVETGGFHLAAPTRCWRSPPSSSRWTTPAGCAAARRMRFTCKPFEGARLDPVSLEVNGIDPWHPLRPAIDEADALQRLFREIRTAIRAHALPARHSRRATTRPSIWASSTRRSSAPASSAIRFIRSRASTPRRSAASALGQTVLRARRAAGGHRMGSAAARTRAAYDAERTADLFCHICNLHARELRARRGKARARWAGRMARPAPLDLVALDEATGRAAVRRRLGRRLARSAASARRSASSAWRCRSRRPARP